MKECIAPYRGQSYLANPFFSFNFETYYVIYNNIKKKIFLYAVKPKLA